MVKDRIVRVSSSVTLQPSAIVGGLLFQTDVDRVVCQTLPEDKALAHGEAVDSLQEPARRIVPLH